ncbi:hypothetical protein ABZ392_44435 [Streptomyces sp. NPDC005885]
MTPPKKPANLGELTGFGGRPPLAERADARLPAAGNACVEEVIR